MVARPPVQGQRTAGPRAARASVVAVSIVLTFVAVPAGAAGRLAVRSSVDAPPRAVQEQVSPRAAQEELSPQAQGADLDPAFTELMAEAEQHLLAGRFAEAADVFRDALGRRPDHLLAATQLGRAQIFAGRNGEARETFARISEDHPESPAGPFGLGQLLLSEDDLDGAREAFRDAIGRREDHYGAWYHLGVVNERLGRNDETVRAYERAVEINPTVRAAALPLARVYLAAGSALRAHEVLQGLVARWPADPEVLTAAGLAAIRAELWTEAREALEAAITVDPGRLDTRFNLATVRLHDGETEGAEAMLRDVLADDPAHCDVRIALSRLLARTGRGPEAASVLENAPEIASTDCDLRSTLATVLAGSPDTSDRAVGLLRELVREDPRDATSRAALGALLEARGELAEALGQLETLAVTNPDDAGLHYRVGSLRRRLGDLEGARTALQRAISLAPTATDAHFEMAIVELQLRRFYEAADRLTRLIYVEPFRAEAYLRLSEALESMGDTQRARAAFDQYQVLRELEEVFREIRGRLAADPEDAGAFLDLARLYAEIGFEEEARQALEEVLRLDPSSAGARELLRQLDEEGRQQDRQEH